jgi:hypothetical protein
MGMCFTSVLFALIGTSNTQAPSGLLYVGASVGVIIVLGRLILEFFEIHRGDASDINGLLTSNITDLGHAVTQLAKNYDILRRQATQGFVLAGVFAVLGVFVIVAGSVGDLFGFTAHTSNLATVAGVVIEVVSGLGFYLFNNTFKRLDATSDRLHETWRILTAFKEADALPDDKKAKVIVTLIERMVEPPR